MPPKTGGPNTKTVRKVPKSPDSDESVNSKPAPLNLNGLPTHIKRRILELMDCTTLWTLYRTTNPDVAPTARQMMKNILDKKCPPVAPPAPRKKK